MKILTAEQRRRFQIWNIPWPVCDCHGEPRRWSPRDTRRGGAFICGYEDRKRDREWRRSARGKAISQRYRERAEYPEQRKVYDKNWGDKNTYVSMFGQTFAIPREFKEFSIQLREDRKQRLKESSNG